MNQQAARQEGLQKLKEKIKDVKVAMMTTAEKDGTLRSRPMHTNTMEEDGVLWFFTGYHSGKTEEIKQDHHVNLSYADPSQELYVSVSGWATLTRNQAKIDELWSPVLKAWFPDGKEDKNISLIRVDVTEAEYWDSPSNSLVQLVGLAKSLATGETYTPGDHDRINL